MEDVRESELLQKYLLAEVNENFQLSEEEEGRLRKRPPLHAGGSRVPTFLFSRNKSWFV